VGPNKERQTASLVPQSLISQADRITQISIAGNATKLDKYSTNKVVAEILGAEFAHIFADKKSSSATDVLFFNKETWAVSSRTIFVVPMSSYVYPLSYARKRITAGFFLPRAKYANSALLRDQAAIASIPI
jgi:hypothetical protein